MALGHLIFYPNQTFEFKTSGTLNQNALSNIKDGSMSARKVDPNFDLTKKTFNKDIHMSKNNKISSLLKPSDDIKDYAHLSSFLKG